MKSIDWAFLSKCIKSLRIEIKWGFRITLGLVLLIEFVLKRIPAPFIGFQIFGDIMLKLCYSFVASVIFYFINVHYPKELKKRKIRRLVYGTLTAVMGDTLLLCSTICDSVGFIKGSTTNEEIKKGVTELNLNEPPMFIHDSGERSQIELGYKTWIDFANNKVQRIISNCKFLFSIHDFASLEIVDSCTNFFRDSQILVFSLAAHNISDETFMRFYENYQELKILVEKDYQVKVMEEYITDVR